LTGAWAKLSHVKLLLFDAGLGRINGVFYVGDGW
jgi:hypothetical protein